MCKIIDIEKLKTFEDRYNYDVSDYIEVKKVEGKRKDGSKYSFSLNYLSWAYAQRIAKTFDPSFKWLPVKNNDDSLIHNGMVLIEMTFLKVTEQHYFPILDAGNRAIANPNSFDINTAQMRGMAKLFAMMSGFGLKLYTGEDIKDIDLTGQNEQKQNTKDNNNKAKELTEDDRPKLIEYVNSHKEAYEKVTKTFKLEKPVEEIPIKKLQTLCSLIKKEIA